MTINYDDNCFKYTLEFDGHLMFFFKQMVVKPFIPNPKCLLQSINEF